ncbi:MAG: hypothetical protein ACE5JL_17435 [Dehalococcoidia bacterium]
MEPSLWTMDLASRWVPLIAGLPPSPVSAIPPITIPRFQMMQPGLVRWRKFAEGETRALAEVK